MEKPAGLVGRPFHGAERGEGEESADTGRGGLPDAGEETL
jgi:hypothetical protein